MRPTRSLFVSVSVVAALVLAATACASPTSPAATPASKQEAPAPKPTEPLRPTSATAPEPTKPAPTAAPKVDFPTKGKAIIMILGTSAGGPTDVGARMLAPLMEKELGTPIQVVNKPGAGWQIGLTELAGSKPDGYTIGFVIFPQAQTLYLDPERKAVFDRKSFQMLGMHVVDAGVIAVKADSPYKTLKDLVDAAKARPEEIKTSAGGVLGDDHIAILQLQKMTGAQFAVVQFDGAAPGLTALLGGHTDVYFGNVGETAPHARAGDMRILGILDKAESPLLPPGVKTVESQLGIKLYSASSRGLIAPAGVPKPVVDILAASIKKAMSDPDHKKKMEEQGLALQFMDPAQMEAYWIDIEEQVKPLMQLAKQK